MEGDWATATATVTARAKLFFVGFRSSVVGRRCYSPVPSSSVRSSPAIPPFSLSFFLNNNQGNQRLNLLAQETRIYAVNQQFHVPCCG